MGITDWAADAVDLVKEAGANPTAWAAGQVVGRVPDEAWAWVPIQASAIEAAADAVVGEGFWGDLSPSNVVPNVVEGVVDVGEWGWGHRDGFSKMQGLAEFLQRLLTNKLFWFLLAAILVLWAVTPLLRFSYRATERPRAVARTANRALHPGVRENAKHGLKRWVDPPKSGKPRQSLSIPNSWKEKYHTGTYAVIEYCNPAPPLEPRAIGVRAYEQSAASRCLRRRVRTGSWRLLRAESLPSGITVFHYGRR